MKQDFAQKSSSDIRNVVLSRSMLSSPSVRGTTKAKSLPRSDLGSNGVTGVAPRIKTRSKTVTPELIVSPKVKRSLGAALNKAKSGEANVGKCLDGSLKARRRSDGDCKGNGGVPDVGKKELEEMVEASENLVKELRVEILGLRSELESLQKLNLELELKNKKFEKDLGAAEARITALTSCGNQSSSDPNPKLEEVQTPTLYNSVMKKDVLEERNIVQAPPETMTNSVAKVVESNVVARPPPPPPPLPLAPARSATPKKDTSLVDFYRTLTKREGSKNANGSAKHSNLVGSNVHNSIVGEIQNRSAHLVAIRLDVETKGELINSIIEKIQTADYNDIEDVLRLVDWIDGELSSLADERSVLKHFSWPESKADAMREAAIEYRDLKRLKVEIASYTDDSTMSCEAALRKISSLLDRSERSLQRLYSLRDSAMVSYRDCKIPTDWMLDSGMVKKIKHVSMKLAKIYMKRVSTELESIRTVEKESIHEALLLQGVRFAYRAHQFAGGLDSETMFVFEKIRQRVPVQCQPLESY